VLAAAIAAGQELVTFPESAWRADPAFRIEDAYKWLFQACQGGEHAAPSREAAQAWLASEWAGLGPALEGEPLACRYARTARSCA
jgi:hypothetical protein